MKKGFSLAELIIVIIILGVITAFSLPNYFRGLEKGRERKAMSQIQQLALGVEAWQANTTAGSFSNLQNLNTINSTFRTDIMLEQGGGIAMDASQTSYLLSITWNNSNKVVSLGSPFTNTTPCCESDNCLTMPDCP